MLSYHFLSRVVPPIHPTYLSWYLSPHDKFSYMDHSQVLLSLAFYYSHIRHIYVPHMWDRFFCISLSLWLTSLSIILSRAIHVAANCMISLSLLPSSIQLHIYAITSLFSHLFPRYFQEQYAKVINEHTKWLSNECLLYCLDYNCFKILDWNWENGWHQPINGKWSIHGLCVLYNNCSLKNDVYEYCNCILQNYKKGKAFGGSIFFDSLNSGLEVI